MLLSKTYEPLHKLKQADGWANYQVEPSLFPMLANWQREHTMEDILTQLKKDMMSPQNRKLAQPPEGSSILLFLDVPCLSIYLCFCSGSCHGAMKI